MPEGQRAMGREIDSPPGVVVIEQAAGALLGQRLPPWQRATGSVRVGDFPQSVSTPSCPGRGSTDNRS
jgi:hypothetical protein